MGSMEEQGRCFYLDSDFQRASDMLRECVGDKTSLYRFNCEENPMRQELPEDVKETARMNDISIQRGFAYYNVDNYNINNFQKTVIKKPIIKKPVIKKTKNLNNNYGFEGFQNKDTFITDNGLGESSIPKGKCPEGYSKDLVTGNCIQQCIGCVYRDNMKSRGFNEGDPCFPNGVYDGITNGGSIKCTCGKDNEYCNNNFVKKLFTTEGMMISGQKIIMNTGLTKDIDDLFNFKFL